MLSLSKQEAKHAFINAQGLGERTNSPNKDHLLMAMKHMKVLQLDSIPVIIRTQYLPLYSRVGAYHQSMLNEIAYDDGDWFESWSHEASLIPIQSEPLFRWRKEESIQKSMRRSLRKVATQEKHYIRDVYEEVKERGPIRSSELEDNREEERGQWWDLSVGAIALEWLYRIGLLGIRRDKNFRKSYDLLERIVPPQILDLPTPSKEEAQRLLLLQAATALGVATDKDLADYFRISAREARPRIEELVEAKELTIVGVDGWDSRGYRAGDLNTSNSNATTFLSPFDPIVWKRDRALRMFNFDYRIEIYVPKAKRKYGYYVLPFLVNGEIVARVDMKTHRKDDRLEVISVHLEDGQNPANVAASMGRELTHLQSLIGVSDIDVRCRSTTGRLLKQPVCE